MYTPSSTAAVKIRAHYFQLTQRRSQTTTNLIWAQTVLSDSGNCAPYDRHPLETLPNELGVDGTNRRQMPEFAALKTSRRK